MIKRYTSLNLSVALTVVQNIARGTAVLAGLPPVRYIHVTPTLLQANLSHPLIWAVDWVRVSSGRYAVVDPHDPTHLVYLTEKEYHKLSNVIATQEDKLTVVAHPYDSKPREKDILAPKPEISPPHPTGTSHFWKGLKSRLGRSYRAYLQGGAAVFAPNKLTERLLIGFLIRIMAISAHLTGNKGFSSLNGEVLNSIKQTISRVYKTRGIVGVVLHLKVSLLLILQYLGKTPKGTWTYGYPVRCVHGLPAWLPVGVRSSIRNRSVRMIRFWVSVLYLYKVLVIPYNVSKAITTITQPPLSLSEDRKGTLLCYRMFLRKFFIPLIGGVRKIPKDEHDKLFAPCTAGPNGSPAVEYAGSDAFAWWSLIESKGENTPLFVALKEVAFLTVTSFGRGVKYKMDRWVFDNLKEFANDHVTDAQEKRGYILSRLHLLGEAAGKVRAVGIMDIFTQRVLRPIHDDLFVVLGNIPQDGTMSQVKLMNQLKSDFKDRGGFWSSLDISAATDSIPVILYRVLLEELYGCTDDAIRLADSIITLMTERDFTLSFDPLLIKGAEGQKVPNIVRYGRGQPMGCLGSFALLGLWNNSWVQFASYSATGKLLKYYGVTGDDVVIRDVDDSSPIAHKYLEFCSVFEIPISLPKSFMSGSLFNFLSRTVIEEGEVSPISWKEELRIETASDRVERAFKLRDRDYWNTTGDGWLSKAVKYFLSPSEYLLHVKDVQRGTLSGYGLRGILSYLVPSTNKIASLGLQGVPIFGWLAACAGSVALLSHGNIAREDAFSSRYTEGQKQTVYSALISTLTEQINAGIQTAVTRGAQYQEWWMEQHECLRQPYTSALFLPHPGAYDSSPLNANGKVEDLILFDFEEAGAQVTIAVRGEEDPSYITWDVPLITLVVPEVSNEEGPRWVSLLTQWLEKLPVIPDFSNIDLFKDASNNLRKEIRRPRSVVSRNEHLMFNALWGAVLLSGGQISMDIPVDLVRAIEKRAMENLHIF